MKKNRHKYIRSRWHIFIFLFLVPTPAFAGGGANADISWFLLVAGLLGGLALFLYGMEKMSEGMKVAAGDKMRSILAALTENRVVGMVVGAFVTCVIQSSSATTSASLRGYATASGATPKSPRNPRIKSRKLLP